MITLHDASNIIVYGMFNSLPILWFLKNQVLLCKKINLKKVKAPKSNCMHNAIAIIILACVVWGQTIQYCFPWSYPVFSDFRILLIVSNPAVESKYIYRRLNLYYEVIFSNVEIFNVTIIITTNSQKLFQILIMLWLQNVAWLAIL